MQRFLFKTVPCSKEIGIKIEMLDKQVRVRKQEISDEMCTQHTNIQRNIEYPKWDQEQFKIAIQIEMLKRQGHT